MPSCSAINCTNRSSTDKSLSFHKIPSENRNKDLRQQWLVHIKRTGNLPKDTSFYMCSAHFEPECFKRDLKVTIFPSHSTHWKDFDESKLI